MIIYKILNKINGKCYVGQTIRNIDVRIYWHLYSAKTGPTSFLHRAIRKYGIQSFEYSIIDIAESKEILNEKEIYWIKELNTKVPNGYNMTDGGTGGSTNKGKHHSKETIQKMSEIKKGENNPFFGKKHSQEKIDQLHKSNIGNKYALGLKHSEEFRAKQSNHWRGDNNPMKNPEIVKKNKLAARINYLKNHPGLYPEIPEKEEMLC